VITVHSSNLNLFVIQALIAEREERLRRTRLLVNEHRSRRLVRRWIGREMVRLGTRLAADPTWRPARAR
jgi:hypothetical protein